MKEPRMPRNTCPAIDSVQESITKAASFADDVMRELDGLNDQLEDLRSANAQLRECAEYWKARVEALEDRISELESK